MNEDEDSAVNFAKLFGYRDARNPVRILTGGFIEFSRKYSFLRSTETVLSQRQLDLVFKVNENTSLFDILSV